MYINEEPGTVPIPVIASQAAPDNLVKHRLAFLIALSQPGLPSWNPCDCVFKLSELKPGPVTVIP